MARRKANKTNNIKSVDIKLSGILLSNVKNLVNKVSWDGDSYEIDEDGKYSITLLVNKESNSGKKVLEYYDDLMDNAYQEFEDFTDVPLGGDTHHKCNIKDGDIKSQFKKYNDNYEGYYVISLKSKKPYAIMDKEGYKIPFEEVTEDEFYPGIVATIQASLFYLNSGNIGVYTTLHRLKKNRDGTPLFEGYNAEVDLDLDEEDAEFFDNYFAEYEGGD